MKLACPVYLSKMNCIKKICIRMSHHSTESLLLTGAHVCFEVEEAKSVWVEPHKDALYFESIRLLSFLG